MLTDSDVSIRLILSVVLGGLIGLERQMNRRNAGLRTNILVCMGSCLIMLTSMYVYEMYRHVANLDPSRIAAGVITGIGFLGAGAIIRERDTIEVRGLTTAACLWVVSAIGLAVGCGFYSASLTTTLLTLIVLFVLRRFESAVFKNDCEKQDKEGKR